MPLPIRSSVCLLCRTRTTIPPSPSVLPISWQATRSMATLRTRRKASRMALSPNAGRSSLKSAKPNRDWRGPFSGMNQTVAPRIGGAAPRSRSAAAQKRSGEDDKPDKKKESPLYKALKMQTMLAPIGYGRRTAIKSKIASITSFDHFPLLPAVRQAIFSQALPGIANVTPTPIQRLAIPQLLDEGSGNKKKAKKEEAGEPQYDQYLLAAETGSGKTLAYLLPVVDAAKRSEVRDLEEQKVIEEQKAKEREERLKNRTFELEPEEAPMTDAGRPRVIILVPTSELVAQVGSTVKALAHTVKYRSGMISSNLSPRRIKNTLFHPSGIDILVSTPHLLSSIAKTNPYVLSRVSHLVLDEADSLMDKSFRPTTTEIIDKVAPSLKKLIFCSATIPRSLDTQLRKLYPDIKRLTTPKLHAIPRRVQLGVVDIEKDPYRGHRNLACADVIWSIGKAGPEESAGQLEQYMEPRVKKIIVFVNEREEAEEVAEFLQSKGIDAVSLSRDSSSRKHEEILAEFTDVATPPTSEEIMLANKRRKQDKAIPFVLEKEDRPTRRLADTKVLVTTDIASRGIDTLAVRTVILYHVPHTTIDFIHRLGRLGRMGKRGRGVVLVGKKDRKDVVREVREGMFRGQALI